MAKGELKLPDGRLKGRLQNSMRAEICQVSAFAALNSHMSECGSLDIEGGPMKHHSARPSASANSGLRKKPW